MGGAKSPASRADRRADEAATTASCGPVRACLFRVRVALTRRLLQISAVDRRWANRSLTVVAALNLAAALLYLAAPQVTERLDPRLILPEAGHAWVSAEPATSARFPYRLPSDTMAAPRASDAVLLDDGKPLGPPHALHDDIRTLGGGRYSLWRGTLYFSTADNSDPRTDGHRYAVRFDAALSRPLIWALVALDGLALFAFRRRIEAAALRYGRAVAALVLAGLLLRVAAAGMGLAAPLFSGSGSLLDMALVRALVLHLGLGILLTAVIFGCGGGVIRLFERADPPLADLLLRAFLPGTLLIGAAALLAVAVPYGGGLALALLGLALLPLYGYRVERAALTRAAEVALLSLPVAAVLGSVMSFRWHGPTATLAGGPLGDMTIYAGWANTLSRHIAPLPNYGVEGGAVGYGDQLVPLLMAALLRYSWFDPYLFMSASLVVMLALSSAVMLALFNGARGAPAGTARRRGPWLWVVIGLVVAAPTYPAWVVESPPVAFLVPIVISTVYLWRSGAGWLIPAAATAVIGAAVSKVVTFVVLVPLLVPGLWAQVRPRLNRWAFFAAALSLALVAIYVALLLRAYLPEYLGIGRFGPLSWDWIVTYHKTVLPAAAAVVLYDLGIVLLAVAATRIGLPGMTLATWSGIACYFAMAFLFQAAATAVMLVVALALVEAPERLDRARGTLVAATALLLPHLLSSDWGGPAVVAAWVLCVGFIVAFALTPARSDIGMPRWQRQAAAVFAILFLAILPAVGIGAVAAGPAADRLIFTPEMRDIWLAVRRDTPPGALIFTDQTDANESRTGGWNDYALTARRQFFFVSWDEDRIRWDPAARARMLQQNERVLEGALRPGALPLSRHYDGYFAVILKTRPAPPGAMLIYRNSRYSLYRLRG
jgi:hypothetical protein